MTRIQMERTQTKMPAGAAKGQTQAKETGEDFKAILRDRPETPEEPAQGKAEGQAKSEKADEGKKPEGEAPEAKEEAAQGAELFYVLGMGQLFKDIQAPQEMTAAVQEPGEVQEEGILTPEAVGPVMEEAALIPDGVQVQEKEPQGLEEQGIPIPEEMTEGKEAQELSGQVQAAADDLPEKISQGKGESEHSLEGLTAQKAEVKKDEDSEKTLFTDEEADGSELGAAVVNQPQQTGSTVKSEKPEVLHVSRTEDLPQEVGRMIDEKMAAGIRQFEIHLEPENLGKIAIKVLFSAGQATVSVLCTEQMTTQLLSQRAGELGAVMERSLGETTILVEEQQPESLYQDQQGYNEAGRESEQEREREQQERQLSRDDSGQFLQKLRLGLTE